MRILKKRTGAPVVAKPANPAYDNNDNNDDGPLTQEAGRPDLPATDLNPELHQEEELTGPSNVRDTPPCFPTSISRF